MAHPSRFPVRRNRRPGTRPHVPLEIFSQATHLLAFRQSDQRDLDRLADLNSDGAAQVRALAAALGPDEVIHLNTRTGRLRLFQRPPPIIGAASL